MKRGHCRLSGKRWKKLGLGVSNADAIRTMAFPMISGVSSANGERLLRDRCQIGDASRHAHMSRPNDTSIIIKGPVIIANDLASCS